MSAAAELDRAELARLAREHTAALTRLRAAVAARAGDANATLLHDDAAGAFHRMLGAAGAYDAAEARDGR